MHAHIHRLAAAPRMLLLAGAVALSLAACGGGDDPLPDDVYISWANSSNNVVVKDWNNDSFAVREDTGQIARYSDDLLLSGLYVTGSNVFYNGTWVARVTYTTATNGTQITDITCNNGLDMDIVVTGSGNTATWTYSCR